ncbi:MAG: rod shape-determining protein RodA [Bacteroidetes bacterium]|nr:rod shape-determining protein RodA [Bacteroidota bacterium]
MLKRSLPIDWTIIICVLILITAGSLAIFSTTINSGVSENFYRQMIWVVISLAMAVSFFFINLRMFQIISILLYGISLILLVLVLLVGREVYGSQSWLYIGPIGIQPSEFTKYTTVLMVANYLSIGKAGRHIWVQPIVGVLIILVPVGLILMQPDTGTALVFLGMTIPLLFWVGLDELVTFVLISPVICAVLAFINFYFFVGFIIIGILFIFAKRSNLFNSLLYISMNLASGFGTVYFIENVLLPHQRKRLEILLDPFIDPKGAGYNVIQSEVAIGSGGWFGKGFMEGTQTQLGFLPKQWTDFIFCVIAEEYGFIGGMILIITFAVLLGRLLTIAGQTKNRFASVFLMGTVLVIGIHLFINLGMTMGLLPIIGIPLPFVSYGGSSMLTFMAFTGTALAIYAQQRDELPSI